MKRSFIRAGFIRAGGVLLLATVAATANAQPTADPMANNAAALAPAGDAVSQVAFAYADRNEDALVSWEEYRNRGMRVFGRVDTNGDGILQMAEQQTLADKMSAAPKRDITIAEYNTALHANFTAADKNKDGALTPTEWRDVIRPSQIN